jgi:chromosome partitioning protein
MLTSEVPSPHGGGGARECSSEAVEAATVAPVPTVAEDWGQVGPVQSRRSLKRVITVSNDKGGVAKTTAAISLAGEAAAEGKKVLLLDAAPQASATIALLGGDAIRGKRPILYNWLQGDIDFEDLIKPVSFGPYSMDIVAGHRNNDQIDRTDPINALPALRDMFAAWTDCPYEYIFLDTDPSYGTLVSMAYMGSDFVICPVRADLLSTAGAAQLKMQVERTRGLSGRGLPILLGFFLTFFDQRKRTCRDVLQFLKDTYPGLIMETLVPDNVRLAEAAGERLPVNLYAPDSSGAQAYGRLWKEIKNRVEREDDLRRSHEGNA